MRTSFLNIGVLESKSEAEMPMPMPHHVRVPFQARAAYSCQVNSPPDVFQTRRRGFTYIWQKIKERNSAEERKNDESQRTFLRLHDDNGPRGGQSSRDCEVEE